jgi:glycosyltransferase involved in cell wall biosynthesis
MSEIKIKNLLFITTSSLATNPRLVKNYIYFKSKGYNCKVIAFVYGDWSDKLSDDIIKKYEIDIQLIPVSRSPLISWIKAAIVERLARFMNQVILTEFWTAVASSKRSYLLWKAIRKLDFKIDFIEAHTLAALYPARFLSKIKQTPFMFDVEDFHPEELIQKNRVQEKQRRIRILKSHLPEAHIVTAASPLIAFHLEQLLDWKKGIVQVLNNSFYANEFIKPKLIQEGKKVKFVWFSQTISFGRGLELFIEAAQMFSDKIELVLIGKIDKQFSDTYINSTNHFIQVVSPMSQLDLHKELSNYDIGLAIEQSSADFNREICLTNKLFAYLQAGLFLVATNTKGQTDFLKDQRSNCVVVNQNVNSFAESIEEIIKSIKGIRLNKENRYSDSIKMSYENEISIIENQLVNLT